MNHAGETQHVETVIVGAGQAGLATAYHLQRRSRPFVVLDASPRIGQYWRDHWDSLHLFTPAKLSRLPGMPAPGSGGWTFPSKDEFAGYLEDYAARYDFDVRLGVHVDRIQRDGDGYLLDAGSQRFHADHVVLAIGAHREARVPDFSSALDPAIFQVHSSKYRNPDQLRPGGALVVGAANSGAEIALELARDGRRDREVWLAGRGVPVFPARPESLAGRVAMPLFYLVASRLLTTDTPMGRRARPFVLQNAAPLIRVKRRDLSRAGVTRVGRVSGVANGRPQLDDETVLDVDNVIWCTGFRVDYSWIDLPTFASGEEPPHDRGVLVDEPGLYLVGQLFQYALASTFIAGVGRDADHIAGVIADRVINAPPSEERERATAATPARRH